MEGVVLMFPLVRSSTSVIKIFVDTNILVYAHDIDAGKKHETARRIVRKLWEGQNAAISLQILQEFFITLTKKLKKPVSLKQAKDFLEMYSAWDVIHFQSIDLLEAVDLQIKYQLSFWDSLVIRAAHMADTPFILTEDLQHGQKIGQLRIHNPFLEEGDFPM